MKRIFPQSWHTLIANIIRSVILLGFLSSAFLLNEPFSAFTCGLAFIVTFTPTILTRQWGLYLNPWIQLLIVFFVFASMFLGEVRSFYYLFPWWDTLLHSISGALLGSIGFTLVYHLNKQERVHIKMSPFFIALFAFCFALAAGAIWEIFEFSVDSLLGMNMQKYLSSEPITGQGPGLIDTMIDLISDASSALIVSTVGYFIIKLRKKGTEE